MDSTQSGVRKESRAAIQFYTVQKELSKEYFHNKLVRSKSVNGLAYKTVLIPNIKLLWPLIFKQHGEK